jgi:putative ABC transport system permease protein
MSLSDIWFLYRARLRARAVLVQEGLAILGIAVGVALLFASQVASTSLTRSVARITHQIVGDTQYQLDARGPDGFDEGLLASVRRIPGVKTALPVLEQQASISGPHGQRSIELIGADPRFAHFAGPVLRRFSAKQLAVQQALALPYPLAQSLGVGPLETVKLQIGIHVTTTLVGATLGPADIGEMANSPVAVAPVDYVQRIAALHHRMTRIFVQARAGNGAQAANGLRRLAAKAHVNFEPANYDSTLFSRAAAPASQSQTLFSAISALVGFMFALNAMLMTVPARRRLVEDVRKQGASRCMTLQILLFDAAVIGVMACVVGLGLGEMLSIAAFHGTPGYLSSAFPIGSERVVTWTSLALAMLCGLGAAATGVLWPLRDIVARPFGIEGRSSAPGRQLSLAHAMLGIGSLCFVGLVLVARPAWAILGCVALFVALISLLPVLFDVIVGIFERIQRPLMGSSSVLAVTELRTPQTRVRSLAIAATGAIALFGVVAIHGAQVNLTSGLEASTRGIDAGADLWVLPAGGSDTFLTIPFKSINTRPVSKVPGVRSVAPYRGSFLNWSDRRIWVRAVPSVTRESIPASQLRSGNLVQAEQEVQRGRWAVMSQALASERDLRIGDTFTLPAPHPMQLRLAGLITNLGWAPGALILNAADYAKAWGSSDPSAYEILLEPGASTAAAQLRIAQELTAIRGLVVETTPERDRRNDEAAIQGLSRLTQIRTLVIIAAILAVVGAIGAMIWQRRDLVAFIKCQGYPRSVLWRWLMCECTLLLATGCAIGTMFGVFGQVLLSHALAKVTGFPVVFDAGVSIALSNFALVTMVAVFIVAVAGYLVVRVPPRTVKPAY